MHGYDLRSSTKRPRRPVDVQSKLEAPVVCSVPEVLRTPLGDLQKLPPELIHYIFSFCQARDLSLLALCSKGARDEVLHYCISSSPPPRLNPASARDPAEQSAALGILMKRLTCLYPTRDRLNVMIPFIARYVRQPCLQSKCEVPGRKVLKTWELYGRFLFAAIAGWDDDECARVYDALVCYADCAACMTRCLYSAPGKHVKDELLLRYFVSCVVLNQVNGYEKAVWLYLFLKPWPIICRARLLFIFNGPCCQHGLLWDFPDDPHLTSTEHMSLAIGQISESLQLLHTQAVKWTTDDTASVLEELLRLPKGWSPFNVARLLQSCGRDIALLVLMSRLRNGHFQEVAYLVAHMLIVEEKGVHVKVAANTLFDAMFALCTRVCDFTAFYSIMPQVFTEMIEECLERHDVQHAENDLEDVILALRSFTTFLLCRDMERLQCLRNIRPVTAEE